MNNIQLFTKAASYDEFIVRKLGIADDEKQYYVPDIVPSREDLLDFAAEKEMGVEKELSKREIVEKLLYEYGITDKEIKDNFRQYLGIEEAFFLEKFNISRELLEELKDKRLLPVVHSVYGIANFIDAEFYFSKEWFDRAVKILNMSNSTAVGVG